MVKTGTWTPEVRKANDLMPFVRVENGISELIALRASASEAVHVLNTAVSATCRRTVP